MIEGTGEGNGTASYDWQVFDQHNWENENTIDGVRKKGNMDI